MNLIHMEEIRKTYEVHPPIDVLKGVNLDVSAGERVAIVGHSGAGKSTLLNVIGLLDTPSGGSYELAGEATAAMRARGRDRMRASLIGFVFQDFHVLGHRTVRENLELKLAISSMPLTQRSEAVNSVLDAVGLNHRAEALTRLLSGGEKQRVAIARAIIGSPQVLLADEPTGNLDEANARGVLELFDARAERGVAVVVITHDERIAHWADRELHLVDGVIRP